MSQVELFDDSQVIDSDYANPMVVLYGKGPEMKCKTCKHFMRMTYHSKTYIKCRLRGVTRSAETDHRVNYRACSMYEDEVSAS